jgi:hypothetical protein
MQLKPGRNMNAARSNLAGIARAGTSAAIPG